MSGMRSELAMPWWTWSNAEAVSIVTRPEPGGRNMAAAYRCPFCLRLLSYGRRRFGDHPDGPEKCRASGLTLTMATALLDAISGRQSVDGFAARHRRPRRPDVTPAERLENHRPDREVTRPLIEKLVVARLDYGLTQDNVAQVAWSTRQSVCEWEKLVSSPRLSKAIRWAYAMMLDFELRGDGRRYRLSDVRYANRLLFHARQTQGLTEIEVARAIGLARERDESELLDLKLDSYVEWAAALGFEVVLVEVYS